MVRKAYLKPPPKLPPVSSTTVPCAPPVKCGSLDCDTNNNNLVRELFANALERAINSTEHTACDEPDDTWAAHPYYDDLEDHGQLQDTAGDELELPWEAHPYYDPHAESDTPYNEDASSEAHEEIAWEEHPYYDTPAEGDTQQTESDNPENNDAPNEVHEEIPWEDHPYYDTPEEELQTESDVPANNVTGEDHSSYDALEEDDELAWKDSPYY